MIRVRFQSFAQLWSHLILRLTYILLFVKGKQITYNSHPMYNLLNFHGLSQSHYAFVFAISVISIPKFAQEEISHPGWQKTMIDEMNALESSGT